MTAVRTKLSFQQSAGTHYLLFGFMVVAIILSTTTTAAAFLNHRPTSSRTVVPTTNDNPKPLQHKLAATSSSVDHDETVISNFESWFHALPRSKLNASIRHAYFGKLRGLSWTSSASSVPSTPVVSVPLSVVLQSDIRPGATTEQDDWDVKLAQQLWTECQRGDQSSMAGYCSFLMNKKNGDKVSTSTSDPPPSTAPNAVRHWTVEERAALLEPTPAGQKLLTLEREQQATWKQKYQTLVAAGTDATTMSWEQFQWAMEVVHSRAFRGNFGTDAKDSSIVSSLLPAILPPLGAAVAGWVYVQNNPYPSDIVLAGLAAVAILPLGFNLLTSSSNPPSAVLLPMIDSANHKEDADSSIAYDPLTKCFQMSIGPQCLTTLQEQPDLQQLCISYGKRSDVELLLNYGFLPGETCADDVPLSVQRERLAKAFVEGRR